MDDTVIGLLSYPLINCGSFLVAETGICYFSPLAPQGYSPAVNLVH